MCAKWHQRLRTSALGNWLAVLLFVGLPFVCANILVNLFIPGADWRDSRNLLKVLVLVTAYCVFVRRWECRPVREFSIPQALSESLIGLLIGGLLFLAVVGVLAALGAYSIEAIPPVSDLLAVATNMLPKIAMGALIEELLFRLVLLRLLERSVGTTLALAASSLVFGLAHMGNEGATALLGIALGVELGLLFGSAYLLTRRIWLCAALHLAWNFVQGAVFSIAVSGHTGEGWLRGQLSGPDWLTGGAFGAEASVVAVMLCLATTGALLMLARRRSLI